MRSNQNFFIIIKNIEKICINNQVDIKFIDSDFILSPETFFKNEYNVYSEIWLATNLIFYILTNLNVFDFVKATNINHNILQNFLYHVDYGVKTWPPVIKQNINISSQLSYLDQIKYNNLKEVCTNYFKYSNFKEILFKNFILGYLLFNQRKNLATIKDELKKDLVKYSFDQKRDIKDRDFKNLKFVEQNGFIDSPNLPVFNSEIVFNNEIDKNKVNQAELNKESEFYKGFINSNLVKRIEIESTPIYYQNISNVQEYVTLKLKEKNILNSSLIEFINSIFVFIPLNLDLLTYYKANILFNLFLFINKNQDNIEKKYNLDEKSFYHFKVVIVNFVQILDEENLKKIINIFLSLYKDKSYEMLIYFVYDNLKKELLNIKAEELIKIDILNEFNMKLNTFFSIKISEIIKQFFEGYLKKIKIFVIILVFILSFVSSFIFLKNLKLFLIVFIIIVVFLILGIYFVLRYVFKLVLDKLGSN